MFLIDGERAKYDPKIAKPGTLQKEIVDTKEHLEKEVGFPITFNIPSRFLKVGSNGLVEYPGQKRLVSRAIVYSDRGSEELIFCERYHYDKDSNLNIYPNKILFDRQLIIQASNWELAVFLYKYSKTTSIELVDTKKIESDKNSARRIKGDVYGCIFSPEKYDLDEEKVRQIALSYGIQFDDFEPVQNELLEAVEFEESRNRKGFDKFIKASKLGRAVTIRANVRIAEKKKLIAFFPDNAQSWGYSGGDGKIGKAITPCKAFDSRYDDLVEYLLSHRAAYTEFKNTLGDSALKESDKE